MRNDELQYYRHENAECIDGGILRITSQFHPVGLVNPKAAKVSQYAACQVQEGDMPWFCELGMRELHYTSSSLVSRRESSGDLVLGQYDARIRFETEINSWPAWWSTGSRGAKQVCSHHLASKLQCVRASAP